jgi:hypothetical protein
MSTAAVYDFTPAEFKRTLGRLTNETSAEPARVFDDMADGVIALEYALTFAGFSYEARQLDLSLIGLISADEEAVKFFDAELAGHVGCSERTVRRWRAAAIKEAFAKNFSFIEIREGEYTRDRTRYLPTAYKVHKSVADYIDATVREARESEEYKRDRREALRRAAENNYQDIEGAPPLKRKRRPRPQPALAIDRDFINAQKNIVKGRCKLAELPEATRDAYFRGEQGAQLRARLLEMRDEIDELLQGYPQPIEGIEVKRVHDILSGLNPECPPPSPGEPNGKYTPEESAGSNEPEAPEAAPPRATCVRVREEETRTQTAEDVEAWESISARLCAARAAPTVERVEIEIGEPAGHVFGEVEPIRIDNINFDPNRNEGRAPGNNQHKRGTLNIVKGSPAAPTDEDRAQYDHEFNERVGIKICAGLAEEEAEAETLDELGCFEFWDFNRIRIDARFNADARSVPASRDIINASG